MAALGWLLNLDFAGGGGVTIPATLEDLTTLWCQEFQPEAHAVQVGDDTTQCRLILDTDVLGYDSEDDLNTAIAKFTDAT